MVVIIYKGYTQMMRTLPLIGIFAILFGVTNDGLFAIGTY